MWSCFFLCTPQDFWLFAGIWRIYTVRCPVKFLQQKWSPCKKSSWVELNCQGNSYTASGELMSFYQHSPHIGDTHLHSHHVQVHLHFGEHSQAHISSHGADILRLAFVPPGYSYARSLFWILHGHMPPRGPYPRTIPNPLYCFFFLFSLSLRTLRTRLPLPYKLY
jgi:hypothetical protein